MNVRGYLALIMAAFPGWVWGAATAPAYPTDTVTTQLILMGIGVLMASPIVFPAQRINALRERVDG